MSDEFDNLVSQLIADQPDERVLAFRLDPLIDPGKVLTSHRVAKLARFANLNYDKLIKEINTLRGFK